MAGMNFGKHLSASESPLNLHGRDLLPPRLDFIARSRRIPA
jgi:hypothetical protein